MEKLLAAWQVPSQVKTGATLFEEDLENLKTLARTWGEQQVQIGGDVEFVQNQGWRIQRIVDGMRKLVRSSTHREQVSCHEVFKEEAISTLSDLLEKGGIQLEQKFLAEQDQVLANRDELIQITLNLLRNAYQSVAATRARGEGEIAVETSNADGWLYLDIKDNGVGISEQNQGKVFGQGFTTKAPSEGTGLGLAICRRYARAMGGDVDLLSSKPGEATIFRIKLPVGA